MGEQWADEFEPYLQEQLKDPEFRGAYEDAENRSDILARLIHGRRYQKISQETVALRMGTTQSAVSELESGATDPRLSTLQRYARATGTAVRVEFASLPGGVGPDGRPHLGSATGANREGTE